MIWQKLFGGIEGLPSSLFQIQDRQNGAQTEEIQGGSGEEERGVSSLFLDEETRWTRVNGWVSDPQAVTSAT